MQISLLPEEVDLVRALVSIPSSNWVAKHLVEKIDANLKMIEEKSKCQHEPGRYIGFKTCCSKCGGYFLEGQGEEWELLPEKEKK